VPLQWRTPWPAELYFALPFFAAYLPLFSASFWWATDAKAQKGVANQLRLSVKLARSVIRGASVLASTLGWAGGERRFANPAMRSTTLGKSRRFRIGL
jgi:hypothetical protein